MLTWPCSGFGRQGCNRDIAFFKAAAIAQGCNILRTDLGLEPSELLFPVPSMVRVVAAFAESRPDSAGKRIGPPADGMVRTAVHNRRPDMRRKRDTQGWLEFQPSNLKLTNEHYARYLAISEMLDGTPDLLDLVHDDLRKALESENRRRIRKKQFRITSEMVLRLTLCQVITGASLREIIVRVDDSSRLRSFTRIHDGPMISHTAFCRLRNAIHPETWKKLNQILARGAVEGELITGEQLRLDTTAVETNIHWPTDSSLLWDGYRTLGRLIGDVREIDPSAVGERRVHLKRAKKTATKIARLAQGKGRKASDLRLLYERLIRQVESICEWTATLVPQLQQRLRSNRYGGFDHIKMGNLVEQLRHFEELISHVVRQATERVLEGRAVSNEEKLFSIFEPHTELLKRGKAGKDIEFGHMIQIQQVGGKFISDYEVFEKKPAEPPLVALALESHRALFGHLPESVAADKGYWAAGVLDGARGVKVVSIPKKGRRSSAEEEREHDPLFQLAQRFRAGVEGSISFLKRCLRLARCLNKGWQNYVSTVGATILAHNLLVLARC
jgi:IS5 family transposase